jgi:histidine triad (HIT) family protein
MSDCPFCDIVAGRAPANVMQSWADAVAIVPLRPVTPGHVLIIPRRHVSDALADPETTAIAFKRASQYARRAGDDEFNLITSAGRAATQTVFHLHVHVVPRRPGDGLALPWTARQEAIT